MSLHQGKVCTDVGIRGPLVSPCISPYSQDAAAEKGWHLTFTKAVVWILSLKSADKQKKIRLIPASAFLCHRAPSQMLPAPQQHLPLCDRVFPFILKSTVWGREITKLLPDVSQPCLCLARFCAVSKSTGVGSPGIASLFSPDSSP